MNSWTVRIIIIILAVAFVPLLINLVSLLAAQVINTIIQGIKELFPPFSMSGDARLGGVIKLCLYLIVITLIAKYLLGIRRG